MERLGVSKPPVFDTLIPCCLHNNILLNRPVLSIVHNILAHLPTYSVELLFSTLYTTISYLQYPAISSTIIY